MKGLNGIMRAAYSKIQNHCKFTLHKESHVGNSCMRFEESGRCKHHAEVRRATDSSKTDDSDIP